MFFSTHNPEKIDIGMICTDVDGDRCVVDGVVDHKYVEVGFWCGDHWSYDGTRVRMDELKPTGEVLS